MEKNQKNSKKVASVVLHWNDEAHTRDCLESLLKLDYSNNTIYLIDNGSTDGSLEQLKQAFPDITYLRLPKNLGFAGGMNAGIKKALRDGAEAVFVLNNDTLFDRNSLRLLVDRLFEDKTCAIAVPMIYQGRTGKIIGSIGGTINWTNGEARHIGHLEVDNGHHQTQSVEFAPGSALLIKATALEAVGLLPEDYFLYCEDVDWSIRFCQAKFLLVTEPKARIWHDESASTGPESPLKQYYYTRNTLLLMKKYCPNWWHFYLNFSYKMFKQSLRHGANRQFKRIAATAWGGCDFWRRQTGLTNRYNP